MTLRALRPRFVAVAVVLGSVLVSACTGERPTLADEPEPVASTSESTTTTVPSEPTAVAQAHADVIDVYPDAESSQPSQQITAEAAASAPGIPIVFLVKQRGDERIEVYLPVQPSGSTGWVLADDVSVSSVPYRIEIALSDRRIRVYEEAALVLDEPIGLGDVSDLVPGGTYFLKELLQPAEPGPYGSYAYGLSGFSNVLTSDDDGEGVTGIHGTDDPGSIGTTEATGCIALDDAAIRRLAEDIGLPLGTPVEILA